MPILRQRRSKESEPKARPEPPLPPPTPRAPRPHIFHGLRRQLSRVFSPEHLRVAGVAVVALGVLGVLVYSGMNVFREKATRSVSVCVVTDVHFRLEQPNWQYKLTLWFAEVNRMFEPSGVQWNPVPAGEAYPDDTQGGLADRREIVEQNRPCQAEVILGFTGRPDAGVNSAVSSFSHTLLVAATHSDSDAIAITTLARALATLFAVDVNTQALVLTDNLDGIFDAASLDLISDLRHYDFSRGISAMSGSWDKRAVAALTRWHAHRTSNPKSEAHRTLGRAFMAAARHTQAIAHFQEAMKTDAADVGLRLELALELQADAQLDEALRQMSEAVRLAPDDARPHALMGGFYFNRREMEKAVDELRIATRLDPKEPSYQNLLGQALSTQLGGSREAESAFEASLRSRPRNASVIQRLVAVQNAADVQASEVAAAESVVRQKPADSAAHMQLGVALAQAGKIGAAVAEIQKSIDLQPGNGLAHIAMARLKYAAGDYLAARRELQTAKAAGASAFPSFVEAVESKLK